MPRIECNIEEFNCRPIQSWRLGGKAHDDGGQGGLWNEGFSWARPNCNILNVRIGLGKAHDHSLFVHSFACSMYVWDMYVDACYVCMGYVYRWMYVGMQCIYMICML